MIKQIERKCKTTYFRLPSIPVLIEVMEGGVLLIENKDYFIKENLLIFKSSDKKRTLAVKYVGSLI